MKRERVPCSLCGTVISVPIVDDAEFPFHVADGELDPPFQRKRTFSFSFDFLNSSSTTRGREETFSSSSSSLIQKGVSLLASKVNAGGGGLSLPSAPPFPFCVNCEGLVAELGELQAQLESIQRLIEERLWTAVKKLRKNATVPPRASAGPGRRHLPRKAKKRGRKKMDADASGDAWPDSPEFEPDHPPSPDQEGLYADDAHATSRTRRKTRKNVKYSDFLCDEDEEELNPDFRKKRRFEKSLKQNRKIPRSSSELLLVEDLEGSEPRRVRLAEKERTAKDIQPKRKLDEGRSEPIVVLKDLKTIISSGKNVDVEDEEDLSNFRFRVEEDAELEESEEIIVKTEPEEFEINLGEDSDSDYLPPDESPGPIDAPDWGEENGVENEVENCDSTKTDKSNAKIQSEENGALNGPEKGMQRVSTKAKKVHDVTSSHQYKMASIKQFTIVEGRKFFLCYGFEDDDQGISCGFPACSFKVLKSSQSNSQEDKSVDFDVQMIRHVRQLHVPQLINEDKDIHVILNERKHRCPLCEVEKMMNIDELRTHCMSNHQFHWADPLFQILPCCVCGKKNSTLNMHYGHMWSHYNELEDTAMKLQGFSRLYQKKKKDLQIQCAHCDKMFARNYQYTTHLKTHVDKSLRPKFLCDVCGKEMTTERGMILHKKRAHNPSELIGKWRQCLQCDKKFLSATHLREHMALRHGGGKEFMCEICGMSFVKKDYLARHSISHQPPDFVPFDCHLCSDRYRYYQGLIRHITSAHGAEHKPLPERTYLDKAKNKPVVHTCRQMFPCLECDEIFEMPRKLYYHRKIHKDVNENKKYEEDEDSCNSDIDMI